VGEGGGEKEGAAGGKVLSGGVSVKLISYNISGLGRMDKRRE